MAAHATNLFLVQDLEDSRRTRQLADSDLNALRTVADWIRTFASPHKDLGRAGPVCPFVPGACERKTLWLAPERSRTSACQMLSRVVVGEFHARNEGAAIRNPNFQPFKAPVPFLLMSHAVVSDWMFFLDNEDWLSLWARRFGETAVRALAETLRRTNWRRLES